MDVSRRLEVAIRRLREAGDADPYTLEAARDELNAVLDEAAYSRRGPTPSAAMDEYPRRAPSPSSGSGLGRSARRLTQVERQLDTMQQFNVLQEEIRWVDEEGSQARRELEERVEARIVAVEARVTALSAMANETETRLKELERRADLQDAISKRSRLTVEELADKVSSVVSELQQRVLAELNSHHGVGGSMVDRREPPLDPFLNGSAAGGTAVSSRYATEAAAAPRYVPVRSSAAAANGAPSSGAKSEGGMIRELMARIEALEQDLDGERDRSIRAVELVANALTPSRARAPSAASPDRPSAASRSARRMSASSPAVPGSARRLNGEDPYATDSPRTSGRAYQ